jgi:SAM-dependent methyltransferase
MAMQSTAGRVAGVDWAERWTQLVREREEAAGRHPDPHYWDRRAPTFARSTRSRVDQFLDVVAPFVSVRKTLIDVGAGTGRHAVPLADRMEWVTAVEPSEGMRALIPPHDNMTVIASAWEDAEVAPADLVICSHVMYGVEQPVPFIAKLDRSARERVFVMMREGDMPHPSVGLRRHVLGNASPPMPQFSDLFMLLVQMGLAPDVDFIRYPVFLRYASMDEALADCRPFLGAEWDETKARAFLEETLARDGDELVFDGGHQLTGIAHWQPQAS